MTQGICTKKPCTKQPEVVCDRECQTVEFHEDNCGCMSYGCKKLDNSTIPVCDDCHVAKQRRIERCDIEKYECVPKRCERPDNGQEVCFEKVKGKNKLDKCGCAKYKKKECSLVPAGDCPIGTVAQGGFDLCGCPHQICVPCKQVYSDELCKPCEKPVKKSVSNGQCEQMVCEPTPECGCPKPDSVPCGDCEEKGQVKLSANCVVETCVPSKAKKCVCKALIDKADKSCGKCEVSKKINKGPCAGVKTCAAQDAKDCPKLGNSKCAPCEKAEVVTDACGCPKYKCSKKPCAPAAKEPLKCEKNPKNCKWFCAVKINGGVVARTTNLKDAQSHLGQGNKNNRQAIIPMTGGTAGDPHTLTKGWGTGSMWWWGWPDINQMREKCAGQQPVCKESKKSTIGVNACGCPVQTCVDKEEVCE